MNYLGIDVAKAKLDCALLDPLTDKRKTKGFTNDISGFKALAGWLGKHDIALTEVHAVLETTGVYHETAALWLADAGITVSIANPAQVKDFARGLAVLKKEITRLQTAIDDHIDRHPSLKTDQAYLLTIPAVGEKTANRMLAILHSRTFKSAEQVAAFLGLVPVEHQSAAAC